ncbi:hypothetical protein GCM10009760_58200 [Kitasatospora kazusensis]|uniref:Secreted protein n=1 Tax=Kitasatospora kazusensis TaxID=407974 RepID=A0ABP5LZV6_9ACTN
MLSAALSTSRVPSLLTATTRSSGTVTSRVVPADVTCVAAPVLSVACPLASGHNLAELPGVSGFCPSSPLWHGCLFATSPVDVSPGCPGRRLMGSRHVDRRLRLHEQYSIRGIRRGGSPLKSPAIHGNLKRRHSNGRPETG